MRKSRSWGIPVRNSACRLISGIDTVSLTRPGRESRSSVNTEDIAAVRGIPVGVDALSPSRHYDIHGLKDLKTHVEILRDITGYTSRVIRNRS